MPDIVGLLTEFGAKVDVIDPEERSVDLATVRVEHDLYVLKQKTDLSLSLVGALHVAGAAIVNAYPASVMLRDKIVTSRMLQGAGVPTPATYLAAHPQQLAPFLDDGPLVVKPYRGSGGRGVRLVRTADDLRDVPAGDWPIFAQRYAAPDDRDLKLYAVGGEFFGVKRVWPATTYEEKLGAALPVSEDLAEIMRRCSRALGLDLFGVDVVESGGQPYVVDASSFPGFKGVPDAPLRVARYVYAAAQRAARGDPVVSVESLAAGTPAPDRAFRGAALRLVLHALSTVPATREELDEIRKLLAQGGKRARKRKR